MKKRIFSGIFNTIIGTIITMNVYAVGNVENGKAKYKVCIACHGENGGGNKIANAPRIAGQFSWYIKRQLYNFKNGVRGSHLNDITGMQMRTMALSLNNDQDFEDVVAYIETLNGRAKHSGIKGDPISGKKNYAVCISCHGANGEGNKLLNSPKIAGLPDWYLESQLHKFRNGIRGVHAKDIYGQQMRPMSMSLENNQAVKDVTAYIRSLKRMTKSESYPKQASLTKNIEKASVSEPLYAACASCHGANGEGNKKLGAPRLAGQNKWYIERQLRNWQQGIRGTHPEDLYGMQMRPMAISLLDDNSFYKLLDFVETLQGEPQKASIKGNIDAGKNNYSTCIACHGANGEGNKALNAPKIAGLPDWYIVRQLHSFKKGIRGTHKGDLYGMQMRPMAMALPNDEAINNVASYVATFKEEVFLVSTKSEEVIAEVSDSLSGSGSIEKGKALYTTCVACHGPDGAGNKALNAPRISGQMDWYVARQLKNFKKGIRGSHEKDIYGQQMRPMSMTLADDQAIADITSYVTTLDGVASKPTLNADADLGKELYAACASCHGANGEGNKALNAPTLAGQQDWYIARQLYNFKNGIRGSHPQDTYGQQMRPMAMSLSDEKAINNIAAYISTLK